MNLKPITIAVFPNGSSVCIACLKGINLVTIGVAFDNSISSKPDRLLGITASPLAQKSQILLECTPHFVKTDFFRDLEKISTLNLKDCLQKYRIPDRHILDGSVTNANLVWHHPESNSIYTADLESDFTLVLNCIPWGG